MQCSSQLSDENMRRLFLFCLTLSSIFLNIGSTQVFTFLLKTESWLWRKLDWSKVTVICYAGWVDEELTRFAHQKNVSVVFIANFPKDQLLNTTYRKVWVDQQVDYA